MNPAASNPVCRAAVALWLCAPLAAAAADSTFAAALSRNERLLLEQLVCGQPFGVGVADIDARSFVANARPQYADVRCRPHAALAGRPLYYVAQCAAEGGRWSCARATLETPVPLAERVLLVRPGTVVPARAVQTIEKISRYGFYQGQSLAAALQGTCTLGMGDAPDLVEISCRHQSITVSYWCPQESAQTPCPRIIYLSGH